MNISRHIKTVGFTVVELLITLVIIAILVSIVIVSYGTYQERTRDAERKSDMQQLATALKTNLTWNGDFIESGSNCGSGGNGEGWISLSSAEVTTYMNSIEQCLIDRGLLDAGEATDPTGCKRNSGGICGGNPTRAYMKMHCTVNGVKRAYVMASLETMPANNAALDSLCTTASGCTVGCTTATWGTSYGMNYYIEVS